MKNQDLYNQRVRFIQKNQKIVSDLMGNIALRVHDPYQAGYNHPEKYVEVIAKALNFIAERMQSGDSLVVAEKTVIMVYLEPAIETLL